MINGLMSRINYSLRLSQCLAFTWHVSGQIKGIVDANDDNSEIILLIWSS